MVLEIYSGLSSPDNFFTQLSELNLVPKASALHKLNLLVISFQFSVGALGKIS
jgi:hypothetical protein